MPLRRKPAFTEMLISVFQAKIPSGARVNVQSTMLGRGSRVFPCCQKLLAMHR